MDSSFFNEDLSGNTPSNIGSIAPAGMNPANGLAMLNGSDTDVEGNPYDCDLHDNWSTDFWPDDE